MPATGCHFPADGAAGDFSPVQARAASEPLDVEKRGLLRTSARWQPVSET